MKKILFVLLAALAVGVVAAQEKKNETIEGNGKIVTKDIAVSSFDALKASGVYELKLSQGDKESVKIEADENLQPYFNVHNDGSKLVIEMKDIKNKNFKIKNKMKVYVTFKKLKELDLSTVGNVVSDNELAFDDLDLNTKSVGNVDLNFTTNKLGLKNTGVGKIKLSGKAQDAVVKNTGVGTLDAGNLLVQTMDIENTGVGAAEVNASKDLKVKDSFLGKVKNKGAAQMKRRNRVSI